MNRVFTVYLAPKDRPNSEAYANLDLPAGPYAVLDALDKLRLQSGEEIYMEISEYHDFEFLALLFDEDCGFYELNALAKRLSELEGSQKTAFEGLVQMDIDKKEGAILTPRLLDLAYSTGCCHVVDEARDDAQLGRFYAQNGFVPEVDSISDRLFDLLDFERIGRELRQGEGGVFTPHGYVVQHSDLQFAPPGITEPPQKPEYVFRLVLDNYPFTKEGHQWLHIPLDLPASDVELQGVLWELDAPSWDEVIITDCDSALPGLKDMADMLDGIEQLNELAQMLKDLDADGSLPKFKALMEATECSDLDIAMQMAKRLDEYVYSKSISSPLEVAVDEMKIVMDDSTAELLSKYVDLYGYGSAIMQRDNAQLTQYGLLEREDGQPILQAAEEIKQQGMEMM